MDDQKDYAFPETFKINHARRIASALIGEKAPFAFTFDKKHAYLHTRMDWLDIVRGIVDRTDKDAGGGPSTDGDEG